MLRTCVAAAKACGTVSVFLEPIALYHTRDLHEAGDGGWLAGYAGPDAWGDAYIPIGRGKTYGTGSDLTINSDPIPIIGGTARFAGSGPWASGPIHSFASSVPATTARVC